MLAALSHAKNELKNWFLLYPQIARHFQCFRTQPESELEVSVSVSR
jgi:hypothetical protein